MKKPNQFFLVLGFLLLFAMVAVGVWSLVIKSKFWTIILVIFAILLAVSGIAALVTAFKNNNSSL